MPIEKHCIASGCLAYPCHGHGLPSKGRMIWACGKHRDLLPGRSSPSQSGRGRAEKDSGQTFSATRRADPSQGKLL